jgi:hypothetical protein
LSRDASESGVENKQEFFYGPRCTLGNTGVTKTGVVERGALRRGEAIEDQKYRRGKHFMMQVANSSAK